MRHFSLNYFSFGSELQARKVCAEFVRCCIGVARTDGSISAGPRKRGRSTCTLRWSFVHPKVFLNWVDDSWRTVFMCEAGGMSTFWTSTRSVVVLLKDQVQGSLHPICNPKKYRPSFPHHLWSGEEAPLALCQALTTAACA
jgi:hypothetical protein